MGKTRGAGCGHCHGGPKIFNELYENNGLDSVPADVGRETISGMAMDHGRFRVVTLRNIALTAPYMHDGRFNTLEEVLEHYNSHIKASATLSPFIRNNSNELHGKTLMLTMEEKKDIIAFLNMLTDSAFVSNPQFSDPFLTNNIK
jgi:cytochrome c peroxidase